MGWIKQALQQAASAGLRLPGLRQAARAAGRSGLLPHRVWRRIPVTGPVGVRLDDRTEICYRSGLMDHLGRILFFGGAGGWEPEILRVLPTLARAAAGVVDVGAHTGLFALIALAANPQARAVAVEPVLANARLLQANLEANRMAGRCVLAVVAAADRPGVVAFDPTPIEVPMTAAIRDAAGADAVRVPAVSLDFVAPWLPSVDLVKIDVEGFEHLVLAGGEQTLRADRPTLVIECLAGSAVESFAGLFDELGYERFHLLPDRAEPVERIRPAADAVTHNYLLVARPAVRDAVRGQPAADGVGGRPR
jgi:FkbM family methyltransferase